MSKTPNRSLLDLAAAIESQAKPATVRRDPIDGLGRPAAHIVAERPAPMALPERAWIDESETLKRQLAEATMCRDAAREQAADLRNKLAASTDYIGAMEAQATKRAQREDAERATLVQRIADLTRELAEARADRAAEDRTAERTIVATDAEAWHFLTPQGEGTADRIKACGGRWVFHKRSERDKHRAAGYWLVPFSPEAGELLINLRFADKRIDVRPL